MLNSSVSAAVQNINTCGGECGNRLGRILQLLDARLDRFAVSFDCTNTPLQFHKSAWSVCSLVPCINARSCCRLQYRYPTCSTTRHSQCSANTVYRWWPAKTLNAFGLWRDNQIQLTTVDNIVFEYPRKALCPLQIKPKGNHMHFQGNMYAIWIRPFYDSTQWWWNPCMHDHTITILYASCTVRFSIFCKHKKKAILESSKAFKRSQAIVIRFGIQQTCNENLFQTR